MRRNEIDTILSALLDSYSGVSDINITVGKPFQVESDGELKGVELQPPVLQLTPFQTEIFALNLVQGNPMLLQTLLKSGSCDCSYQLGPKARFRVNIFSQRGAYSIVLRKLSSQVPSIADMKLPKEFHKMAEEKNGLILVTGATGSGKSTSLAALLRHINETKAVHVVTLEDPIEFEHHHIKATFNQREQGMDFDSFASGLRAALRQAPKVILVGEMRDRESVEIALTAAETGHMVLSTLHTINAGQTINRILGLFEKEEEPLVRMRLAETLRWVVCQKLVPKIGGGRAAVLEIMTRTMRIQEIILKGESEDKQFYEVISDGVTYGMRTFDQHLLTLFEEGIVSEETVRGYCSRKSYTIQGLDKIKAAKGLSTSELGNLQLDTKPATPVAEKPEEIMPTQNMAKQTKTSAGFHPSFHQPPGTGAPQTLPKTSTFLPPAPKGAALPQPQRPQPKKPTTSTDKDLDNLQMDN